MDFQDNTAATLSRMSPSFNCQGPLLPLLSNPPSLSRLPISPPLRHRRPHTSGVAMEGPDWARTLPCAPEPKAIPQHSLQLCLQDPINSTSNPICPRLTRLWVIYRVQQISAPPRDEHEEMTHLPPYICANGARARAQKTRIQFRMATE